MGDGPWMLLGIEVLLLVGSALFSSAETALFGLDDARLSKLTLGSGKTAGRLAELLSDRRRLLVSILLANLTLNVLYFNLGALLMQRIDDPWVRGSVPLALLVALVLVGEVFPKTLAVHDGARVCRIAAAPLLFVVRLTTYPRIVLGGIAAFISRLFMGAKQQEGKITSTELEGLVRLAHQEGQIPVHEARYLQALLLLSELNVREIMVPRVEMVACRLSDGRERFLEILAENRRNKVPVFEESIDHLLGYLDAKDVLTHPEASLESLVRSITFVPETATAAEVIDNLLSKQVRLVCVLDEYGGTEGLITLEVVIESVLGDLADEEDEEEEALPIVRLAPDRFEVSGLLRVSLLRQITPSLPESSPVATVSGLVSSLLGGFPKVGDVCEGERVRFRVLAVKGPLATRVEVTILPAPTMWELPR